MRSPSRLLAAFVLLAGCGSVMSTPDGGTGGATAGKGGNAAKGGASGAGTGGTSAGGTGGNGGAIGGASGAGTGGVSAGGTGGAPAGTGGSGGATGGSGGATGGSGGATGGRGGMGGGPDNRGGQSGTDGAGRGGSGGGLLGLGGLGGIVAGCLPACDVMHTCVGSTCLLNQGAPCTLASQCASGACTAFYQDLDGDGYGVGAATGFCGTTAPVGYAAANGDCCDDANHVAVAKLIHPGAAYQATSAGGICNITWDYDCSGKIDKSVPMYGCDPNYMQPNCKQTTAEYPDSTCGTNVGGCACGGAIMGTGCSTFCQSVQQTCK